MNLDIGGQNNRDDQNGKWRIVDLHDGADFKINLETDSLSIASETVSNIYSSHCIEHIEPSKLRNVFFEMHRVLKKSGKIRIVVPSFKKGVFYYLFMPWKFKQALMPRLNSNTPDTKMSRFSAWIYSEIEPNNGTPGHKTAWDFELMKAYLEEAGFINIKKMKLKKHSEIFKNKDNPLYEDFSLYVEAEK